MTALAIEISRELANDAAAVERLHEHAFGPGRFARTAFRLREDGRHVAELAFIARVGTLPVGSVRVSAITIGGAPALVLGPLTVEPAFGNRGIGGTLLQAAIEAARARGDAFMILVGDEPYYRRFGFKRIPHGQIILPGPADPARILYLELQPGALAGMSGRAMPG